MQFLQAELATAQKIAAACASNVQQAKTALSAVEQQLAKLKGDLHAVAGRLAALQQPLADTTGKWLQAKQDAEQFLIKEMDPARVTVARLDTEYAKLAPKE